MSSNPWIETWTSPLVEPEVRKVTRKNRLVQTRTGTTRQEH